MFARTLFLGALVLGLAACQSNEADTVAVQTDPMVTDPMATDPMMTDPMMDSGAMADTTVTAQSTVDAAEQAGGVTSLPVAAALSNIDGWIARLDGNADAAPVVENLRTLRSQLTASPIDGAAVGRTLTTLGEQTTAVAAGAGGERGALERLGSALSQAGRNLTGN